MSHTLGTFCYGVRPQQVVSPLGTTTAVTSTKVHSPATAKHGVEKILSFDKPKVCFGVSLNIPTCVHRALSSPGP